MCRYCHYPVNYLSPFNLTNRITASQVEGFSIYNDLHLTCHKIFTSVKKVHKFIIIIIIGVCFSQKNLFKSTMFVQFSTKLHFLLTGTATSKICSWHCTRNLSIIFRFKLQIAQIYIVQNKGAFFSKARGPCLFLCWRMGLLPNCIIFKRTLQNLTWP